ncbi:MAG: hypothetical protein ACF788_05455, partial [Novipirellula sp. JB048]
MNRPISKFPALSESPALSRSLPSSKSLTLLATLAGVVFIHAACSPSLGAAEYLSGIEWQKPAVVTPGKTDSDPPSDAVVLFAGEDLSAWENGDRWTVRDGVASPGKG